MRIALRFGFRFFVVLWALHGSVVWSTEEIPMLLREALEAACSTPPPSPGEMMERIPGSVSVSEKTLEMRGVDIGWQRRLGLPDGEVRIERIAPGGRLRQWTVEYWTIVADDDRRPRLALVADSACNIRFGRRLIYEDTDATTATTIEHLDEALNPTGQREPLNPPVPENVDPGGVPVAMIDAGVNYLLPPIGRRLARGGNGEILGYDYWDLDRRPFDAHPQRSPFFPQRHGTRTASLLLREAPEVRLVPYRYPRPDMRRMTDLLDDAASRGIRLFNMSLGSDDREDWEAFAAAAALYPDTLFVVSAGNNGRDIDARPVYPAALPLGNTITVSSADSSGNPAPGSNWGRRSVDVLVPAEQLATTDFGGDEIAVSGSSYAAVRVTALAARLLAAHRDWGARELKEAIFKRVLPVFSKESEQVRHGFIPRPDKAENLPLFADHGPVRELGRYVFKTDNLYGGPDALPPADQYLALSLAYFSDTGWRADDLRAYAGQAAEILAQCGITVAEVDTHRLEGPEVFNYFHDTIGAELVRRLALPKPTVFFIKDTLQTDPYDAESIGKGNSASRPLLRDTIWITEATADPGIALAHELAHLLMNDGRHEDIPGNLMRSRTAPTHTGLTSDQCQAMVQAGRDNGLLKEI